MDSLGRAGQIIANIGPDIVSEVTDRENISGIVISFKLSDYVTISDTLNNPFKNNNKVVRNRIFINLEGDIAGHLTRIFDTYY